MHNKQAFESYSHQLRDAAADLGHNVGQLGKLTKELAGDTAKYLGSNASDLYHQSRDGIQKFERSIEETIRKNPLQAVAIAAGVGLILGMVWRRR